jgi:transcriptional regulator with XRE-family HTH domain
VHLRTRRQNVGSNLAQVARNLGVRLSTYQAWENDQVAPAIKNIPAIIQFLGYCPFDRGLRFGDQIALWRSVNGITQKEFSELMGLDQTTLARWERGDGKPHPILRRRLLASRTMVGDRGMELLYESSKAAPTVGKQAAATRPVQGPTRIPKLRVGQVEIDFTHHLFVEYDARWTPDKKLEAWRTSLSLSQRHFADLVGFAPKTIRRWEKGQRFPSEDHVLRIRSVLAKIVGGSR